MKNHHHNNQKETKPKQQQKNQTETKNPKLKVSPNFPLSGSMKLRVIKDYLNSQVNIVLHASVFECFSSRQTYICMCISQEGERLCIARLPLSPSPGRRLVVLSVSVSLSLNLPFPVSTEVNVNWSPPTRSRLGSLHHSCLCRAGQKCKPLGTEMAMAAEVSERSHRKLVGRVHKYYQEGRKLF